jgi:amidophosphoribosyltransferase
MSDLIQHECGIALIRLKKPMDYYSAKYGTPLYAFNRLFLLMEKQHNRGQDGAGIGCVKLNMPKGSSYMFRERLLDDNSLSRLFRKQLKCYDKLVRLGAIDPSLAETVKNNFDFGGEVLMGHLRYGTSGEFRESSCHPYFRRSNWPTRNLMVLGNFNMTNTSDLNAKLIERGQHPIFDTDTQTVLEEIGFHLDEMHQDLYHEYREQGVSGERIPELISSQLDIPTLIRESAKIWDGGYVIAGLIGNGDAFVLRDPNGIRPGFFFENDELIAFASERVPLMTVFELEQDQVQEMEPGMVYTVKADGRFIMDRFADERPKTACSFERIYFSRGNDPEIYQERKRLGAALVNQLLEAIDYNLEDTVFSFIPNTAETAFYGLLSGLRVYRRSEVKRAIIEAMQNGMLSEDMLDDLILKNWPRNEKIAHKDIKLRTFISQEAGRSKMVSHIYDITYGIVAPTDNLVVLDDSIVRGTTLRQSIIKMLSRARPKSIIIASTAPQIRYPDCYGIDMSELGKFVAFQAAVSLLIERGMVGVLDSVYQSCLEELKKPVAEQTNCVRAVYEPFTDEELCARIALILSPKDIDWKGSIKIVYQTVENLHKAIPACTGDWYFTGNYPTPGGVRVANSAFVHYYEKKTGRSYDRK